MAVELNRYRFTVEEYDRMAEAGIFDEDSRVELIEGEIVEMAAMGPGHAASVRRVSKVFEHALGDVAQISTQCPVVLDARNKPEPDVALLRPRPDFYAAAHPSPDDILLVIEVSDSSLAADRTDKAQLYARAGVPETWILDLVHGFVYVYREPSEDGYLLIRTARRGDRVAPLASPEREFDVADLLG
jgi:Uma2 family endonuclease